METQEERIKKMLLVLPLLVLPFLALGFYVLGGGKEMANGSGATANGKGINTTLPDATFKKDEPQNKLSIYEITRSRPDKSDSLPASVTSQAFGDISVDANEQRINDRLAQINAEINRPVPEISYETKYPRFTDDNSMSGDVDRLEKLMHTMQVDKTEDSEMRQLNDMLDKIVAIQNPDSAVLKKLTSHTVTAKDAETRFKAIPAQIVEKQRAVQGATIKLRLQDTVTLYGCLIPKGHEIAGTCRITNQRLLLDIKNIRLGISIIPVDLSVYSLDGMPGLYAPEAELSDAVGLGADDMVRSLGLYGMDQNLGTQVAAASIDAAKSLFSKKIRKVKVKLVAGQPVLLRNNQQNIR
jgi:hypothetical protein